METPAPKKRRRLLPIVLGLVVLCVVLAFIGALLSPSEEPAVPTAEQPPESVPAATVAAQPTDTPKPTETPTPTPTLEDQILAAIGPVNRSDAPAPSILISDQVVVVFPANDGLSAGMIRRDTQRRAMSIAQAVRDNTGNAHDLRITASGPLIDAYGNTSEEHVMRISLNRPTLEKINFDGFQIDNLPLIADDYWQHPAISE